MAKQYMYSEVFHSFQGEGHYTGVPTLWLRFFLCNLQCNGFGQKDPTNPDTYQLPYLDLDLEEVDENGEKKYQRMKDLPVFEFGCDSSYSWSKKYKGLQYKGTAAEIAEDLLNHSYNGNTEESRAHLAATNHLCFTGGEPLMKHAQSATVEIMDYFASEHGMIFPSVTYETNGTQDLSREFVEGWQRFQDRGTELFFSLSPKLWSTSGEEVEKAIPVHNVVDYYELSNKGQLKFVVNGTQQSWDEAEDAIARFRAAGIDYPVWIMPSGATKEQQSLPTVAEISNEAIKRGYAVSARVHTYIYGNQIGT